VNASSVQLAAAGRAYQIVAQATAIAVQDATDFLRNMSTLSATAAGIGLAQVIAGDTSAGTATIAAAQTVAQNAIIIFSGIGTAATAVATEYPKSFG
jgi:hypothetical protein